jgi:hypothetical protein
LVTIIAEKRGTLSNGGAARHPRLTAARSETKKGRSYERPFIGRPDSANPYVRSALLSEVVSANVIQRIPAQEILSCSGGDTQKKLRRQYCGAARRSAMRRIATLLVETAKLFAAAH